MRGNGRQNAITQGLLTLIRSLLLKKIRSESSVGVPVRHASSSLWLFKLSKHNFNMGDGELLKLAQGERPLGSFSQIKGNYIISLVCVIWQTTNLKGQGLFPAYCLLKYLHSTYSHIKGVCVCVCERVYLCVYM